MAKCKCCEQEEIGYGTLLDKRGYCRGCSQHSINECEEQNARLQSELDKTIKQLKDYEKALKDYAECEPIEIKREYWNGEKSSINCTMADIGVSARKTLKRWEDK